MSRTDRNVASSVVSQLRNRAQQAGWAHDPVGWAKDVLGVHLWSKQAQIAQSVVDNKRTVVASCHGTGKALAVEELLPLPDGTSRPMGEIEPGMAVLGSDGKPVKVVASTGIHRSDQYEIHLKGLHTEVAITASGNHLWPVLSTRDVAAAQVKCDRSHVPLHTGLWHHRLRQVRTKDLVRRLADHQRLVIPAPIPPTASGPAWQPNAWMRMVLANHGRLNAQGQVALVWRTPVTSDPPEDLEAARFWLKDRSVHTTLSRTRIQGGIEWSLALPPHSLPREALTPDERAAVFSRELSMGDPGWEITRVVPRGEGDVQCIQVDSPDHLYLCTDHHIPTHNSMIASVLACWWISTKPLGEAVVVSSAPTYAQVNKILWEEIRKHHSAARRRGKSLVGRVTQGDEWKADDGQILAFGRKPPAGDQGRHAFQGIHRRYVLVILDEACGIGEELWTGAEAITTTDHCRILAIGNPDDRTTEFGDVFLKPSAAQDWHRISVPASSTPNFTGETVPPLLNEVLVSRAWCEERLRNWGEKDPRYISKVLARFPEQSKSSLFPPALIAQASQDVPSQPTGSVVRLGVDVARFGTDQNVVVSYAGVTARIEDVWTGTDTVSSAYQVLEIAERVKERLKSPWVEIRVDAVGLGAGVVDTLGARATLLPDPWFSVYEMHGSASPPVDVGGSVHGYGNARAFWFDQLRQSMRNGRVRFEPDSRLTDDLAIVFYAFKNGKLFLLSKEEMRKEHGRSPDYADALAYATSPVSDSLPTGSSLSQDADDLAEELEDALTESEITIAPY